MNRMMVKGIGVLSLMMMSACELGAEEDELFEAEAAENGELGEELSSLRGKEPPVPEELGDPAALALPVCDWVAKWDGAWVPFDLVGSGGTIDCRMAEGHGGEGVKRLQHNLNRCNGENLDEDGDFGPATKAAVLRVQRRGGITQDGEYGPNTRRKMRHVAVAGGCITVR